MSANIQPSKPSRLINYFLAILLIVGIYSYVPEKKNKPDIKNDVHKQINNPTQSQTKQKPSEISFDDFLSALKQNQLNTENSATESSATNHDDSGSYQNENNSNQTNQILAEAQQAQKEAEYQELITNFNQVEGDNKILLLQRLWKLAPEVGIENNLLTLLQLATYDPDTQVEKISREILNDLQRFRDGTISQEEQLVSQIMEMNNNQHGSDGSLENNKPLIDDQVEPNTALPVKIAQQKNEKIDQLTKLALTSENTKTREYALMNLVQFDHDATLDVIQHQLLNSSSSDERFKAIEILRSSIGDYDSNLIRQILEMATSDYDASISENATNILEMLDNYIQIQNNPAELDLNTPVIQQNPDQNAGISNPLNN